jgi:hypothetical protein
VPPVLGSHGGVFHRGAPDRRVGWRVVIGGLRMAKRPSADERQADFFGSADRASPPSPAPRPQERRSKGRPGGGTDEPAAPVAPAAEATPSIEATPASLAARATPAELDEFVGALSDEGLAHLALESVRAVRRRLAKGAARGVRGSKGRAAGALERAACQLAAELGGAETSGGEDT